MPQVVVTFLFFVLLTGDICYGSGQAVSSKSLGVGSYSVNVRNIELENFNKCEGKQGTVLF